MREFDNERFRFGSSRFADTSDIPREYFLKSNTSLQVGF